MSDGSDWRTRVGCEFIMMSGRYSGRVVVCGVCEWCRSPAYDELKADLAAGVPQEEESHNGK